MSGLAGIYNLDGAPVDLALLERMTAAIAHRGPDGIHQWADGPVAMGHCMLQTTPESVYERQPLTDESGNLCLTMDGRVDDREELLAALKSRGARLRDDTDAEIVLNAYQCWGEDCPVRILGDFAFVIWDRRQRQLFCARDILGVKPFYYYTDGRKFLWASELHQLFQDASVPRAPNEEMVAEYLAASLTNREETLYQGIMRLAPAHSLLLRAGRRTKSWYWDIDPGREIRHRSDKEYAEHFLELFKEAVRCRLRSHKPVGAELSGGLDSSSVVGMAQSLFHGGHNGGRDFQTISLVFPGMACDESPYIDEAARMWGVRSNRVAYEMPSPEAYFEQARLYQDFPNFPNGMMWDRASALMGRMGFRVLLTGCGGDEWFTGSYYHYADFLRGLKFATLLRQLRADQEFDRDGAVAPAIVFPRAAFLRVGIYPLLPGFAQRTVKWLLGRKFKPPSWIESEFASRSRLSDRVGSAPANRKFPTFAQEDMYRSLIDGWAVQGYELGDRSESRFGLERRHPLSDRRVIEFAFGLPEDQRWHESQPKRLLRNAVSGLIPETVRRRRTKADFSRIFLDSMRTLGGKRFFESLAVASTGWINRERILHAWNAMSEETQGSVMTNCFALWMSCGIEAWFRGAAGPSGTSSSDAIPAAELQPA